ncbi:uncharacterized protein LOC130783093 isoform X2 [Actinidia eriantha]|uniref:uncharacterized protein LOC130783093 isoform X2 n=1 Tax=Actinidia eriantha TaxID=165200 RepID=UPI002582EC04|nr:uncharacterized protein LOC130783093 isoform X2 [Actinidia eriantha]
MRGRCVIAPRANVNAWFEGVLGHFPGTMEYISTGWMIGSTCIHQNVEPFLCIIFILYDGLPASSKRWSQNKEKESDIFDIDFESMDRQPVSEMFKDVPPVDLPNIPKKKHKRKKTKSTSSPKSSSSSRSSRAAKSKAKFVEENARPANLEVV